MQYDVYIRPLKREDAEISWKWRNDPAIWVYTGSRPDRHITREIELEWIDRVLADPTCYRFAICLSENDTYIGNVQLTNVENDHAEFHIFIGNKNFWGHGIATKASELILTFARDTLKLKMLELTVHPQNLAAIRVYKKIGFVPLDNKIHMINHLV